MQHHATSSNTRNGQDILPLKFYGDLHCVLKFSIQSYPSHRPLSKSAEKTCSTCSPAAPLLYP